MASRSNLSGRKSGFGRGPLSKVYGKAKKMAAANREAGGVRRGLGEAGAKSMSDRMIRETPGGSMETLAQSQRGPKLGRGARRDAAITAQQGTVGEKSAPGLDQLTGGGGPLSRMAGKGGLMRQLREGAQRLAPPPEAIQATPAPPAPDIKINPLPGGGGRRRPRKMQSAIDHAAIAPAASLTPPVAGTPQGTAPLAPQPESSNIAISDAPNTPTANAPGGRSVRSRGLHRSRVS